MGIKNPTDPLHYFFSCVNNKVEIHLKYRLGFFVKFGGTSSIVNK